jgi:hypothetical protein
VGFSYERDEEFIDCLGRASALDQEEFRKLAERMAEERERVFQINVMNIKDVFATLVRSKPATGAEV